MTFTGRQLTVHDVVCEGLFGLLKVEAGTHPACVNLALETDVADVSAHRRIVVTR